MSFDRRNSPARKKLLLEGRARMAVMAAGAAVIGGASGAGIPAMAGSDPSGAEAACADPNRTTPVVVVDGAEVDCTKLGETPASGEAPADPPATEPEPAAEKPEPAAEPAAPAEPAEPATPATPAESAAPAEAATPAEPATPATPAESAAPSHGSDGDEAAADAAKATALAKQDEQADGERKAAQSRDAAAEKTKTSVEKTEKSTVKKITAKRAAKAQKARRDHAAEVAAKDLQAAATYASLPAEWTSLTPIMLPAYGVDDFPIPPFLLPIYIAAAAEYGVPWEVLASINEIESNFGRNAGISSAGAMGWMQFIPSSWEIWGRDGDGDLRRDPRHPVDAIFAAANYLHEAGAQTDLPKAIFAYNHADWYVNRVVERAREFASLDKIMVAALTERALREDSAKYVARGNPFAGANSRKPTPGQALLLSKRMLTRLVLKSENIKLYEGGRRDIEAGHIDRRVLATLVFLERSGLHPTVTSLFSGHSRYTTSGNVSAHSYGHAVDIAAINGTPIMGNQGGGSVTEDALRKLIELQGYLQPNQVISLMTIDGQSNTIAMGDHDDHIHLGFPRIPRVSDGDRPEDVARIAARFRREDARRQKVRRTTNARSNASSSSVSLRVPLPLAARAGTVG